MGTQAVGTSASGVPSTWDPLWDGAVQGVGIHTSPGSHGVSTCINARNHA